MENSKNKKQIAVFGGSFNPPLYSHFSLAEQLINEYEQIEKVLFIPVSNKYQKANLVSDEHRYQMLKLVCNNNEHFEVSRIEMDAQRQYHTYETLVLLQKEYEEYEIAFVTGSDNLQELETWGYSDKLAKEFKTYVLERGDDNVQKMIESDEFLFKNKDSFIIVKKNIRTNMSSTFVRGKLKEGKSIKYLAPDEIIDYIKDNNLYM